MKEVEGNRVKDPDEGTTGNQKPTPKPEDLILGKFKTDEDVRKAYIERDKQAAQAVEKLRKLEEEKEVNLDQIVGTRDTEIEELKRQLKEIQTPKPAGRYNPEYVKKIEELVGLPEGKGAEYLDLHRGISAYDRRMESKGKSEIANKREVAKQWKEVKKDYEDDIREMTSEISTVLDKYPELKASAHENPDAMRDVVRLAKEMHEENVQALKAEEELREQEKEAAQTGKPGGTSADEDEVHRMKTMPLDELEREVFGSEGGEPSPFFEP